MRCYRLPGFQSRLLLELQRQQNNTLFCDTLLQTEDVSIPAHGCVLAALSPYLSRRLSATPHPPAGQQRKVKLQAVDAQTLLKLVGLLYSGLLEVNETADQGDVLAAAIKLGLDRLVEGQEGGGGGEVAGAGRAVGGAASQRAEERKGREKRAACDAEARAETRRGRDAGTQVEGAGSVDAATQTVGAQGDARPSRPPRDDGPLPGELHPGAPTAPSDETGLSKEVTKTTTTKSPRSTRVSSEPSYCVRPKPGSLKRNHRKTGSRETAGGGGNEPGGGRSAQRKGKEMRTRRGKTAGGWSPKRGSAQTREIAIKVKLRRVKQGAAWEVVQMRDMGQRRALGRSQAVFAALKKDRAKLLRTQTEGPKGPPAASTSQPSPLNKQPQGPGMSLALTGQAPRIEVFADLQSPANPCHTPESDDSMTALLAQAQGPVEESDREIEKLLEDIMMGLNILPSSGPEKDGDRSSFKANGAAIPSAPPPALDWTARQGEGDAAPGVIGSQGYKTLWEDAAAARDTVLHSQSSSCLVPAAASAASAVHCADTWPQTERQSNQIAQEQPASNDSSPNEGFTQCRSLSHGEQGDTTDRRALRFEPVDCRDLPTLNVASIAPGTVASDSRQTDRPAFEELTWLSSSLHELQFPLSLGAKEESKPSEPGEPSGLESPEDQALLQSSRPSAEVMQKKRKPSVKKLCVKDAKEKMQSSEREGPTGAISPCGKAPNRDDPPLKQCDTEDKPVTSERKRKCEAHTDDASDCTSGYKLTRHAAGEFSQIFLNVCSVSLSCNNVLSKRRIPTQEPPLFKEPQKALDTTAVDKGSDKLKADKTITKTRKRSTPRARSASTTKGKGAENVLVIKRKRGRPRKIKSVPHDANPSTDRILESDRNTNAKAEIREQCGQNKGKLRRKCREIVQNVPISNDEVHDDVQRSDAVKALEPESSPPRVDDEQLCAQPPDPSEPEPNEHRTGSENTHTEEDKRTGNPDSRVNPAVKPAESKRTPTVSLKQFKQLIKFRHFTIRGTRAKVASSEVEENVHSDGKACENTDRCEATSSEGVIGSATTPTKNANLNRVIATESPKSKVGVTVSQDKRGSHLQGQKGNHVPLEAEDKKGKDYNMADVVVKASPLVGRSSSIACKIGDPRIAQHPGHSAASETSGKPETMQPRPTVEPVMGLKKPDDERWVEADDLSSKDIGFHSNKGEEETSEVEIEEMGEAVLGGGPGDERLVERPDEASDSANSTAPVEDFTPCWVRPSPQSNVTPPTLAPQTPNRRSRDVEGSRHSQEDEDEEMEVDILLCSPDRVREPMEFGGRVIVDTSPDEDEEELKEIDVMGI